MVQRKDSLKFQKIVAIYVLRGDGFSEPGRRWFCPCAD
jgi:hypothetical protein